MDKTVIIVGASSHGKVVLDIVRRCGDVCLGFLDDSRAGETLLGLPVLGRCGDFARWPEAEFVIAIGNAAVRQRLAEQMTGAAWYTAIHPTAVISPLDTAVGQGTVIMANAVVNPGARIGSHCIINTGAIVEHDARVGDLAHISVGAKLAGTVRIGTRTWVGIGAVVSNNCSVAPDCVLGAGTVVVRDLTEPGTYVGVPARKLNAKETV